MGKDYYDFLMKDFENRNPDFTWWAFSKNINNWRSVDDVTISASRSFKTGYLAYTGKYVDDDFTLGPVNLLELLMELAYPYCFSNKTQAGSPFDAEVCNYIFWKIVEDAGFLNGKGGFNFYEFVYEAMMDGDIFNKLPTKYIHRSLRDQCDILFLKEGITELGDNRKKTLAEKSSY